MASYTVVEVHTGEALEIDGDPVLFDSREQAEVWALAHGFVGREYAVEAV
jgi:hypothetical protein